VEQFELSNSILHGAELCCLTATVAAAGDILRDDHLHFLYLENFRVRFSLEALAAGTSRGGVDMERIVTCPPDAVSSSSCCGARCALPTLELKMRTTISNVVAKDVNIDPVTVLPRATAPSGSESSKAFKTVHRGAVLSLTLLLARSLLVPTSLCGMVARV
jgi:hypothetical protein